MGWGVIQMEMGFLYRFAMVALRVREPEQSLLEKVIFLIPEAKGNILYSMRVRNAGYAVFAPSIRSRSGMVIGEIYCSLAFELLA